MLPYYPARDGHPSIMDPEAATKLSPLGTVDATDERDAIEKVAKERNIPAKRLIATRHRSRAS